MIPSCPGWDQKAAFELMLGLMQLLLGISSLSLGILILYAFIVCIYARDVGKGLTGICWDGAQNMGGMDTPGAAETPAGTRRALGLRTGDNVG